VWGGKDEIPWQDFKGAHSGRMFQFEESGTIEIHVYEDGFSRVKICSDKGRQFWKALVDAGIFEGGPLQKKKTKTNRDQYDPDYKKLMVEAYGLYRVKTKGGSMTYFLAQEYKYIIALFGANTDARDEAKRIIAVELNKIGFTWQKRNGKDDSVFERSPLVTEQSLRTWSKR
jgi:hypothetical protein